MPRGPRHAPGGLVYHVMNRAAARQTLFRKDADFAAFEAILREGLARVPTMRVLAWCVMPNHFHLVLWPGKDGDLSRYVRWVTNTHTKRWRAHTRTTGHGALYQGRFKSFPCQSDHHYVTVLRYVERNPLRAGLVTRAADWPWSSHARRAHDRPRRAVPAAGAAGGTAADAKSGADAERQLAPVPGPIPMPDGWRALVDRPQSQAELHAVRVAVKRNRPFGDPTWQRNTARRLRLAHTLRPIGRPRKLGQAVRGSGADLKE
jgi:putative transposase